MDPLEWTPDDLPSGVVLGQRVRARALGWDGAYPDDGDREGIERDELGDTALEGFIAATPTSFGTWRVTVGGRAIDPNTIQPLDA